MLAIVHPIDPQDQLIVYLLDSRKDDPVHLSLDELIERGRKEVKKAIRSFRTQRRAPILCNISSSFHELG